MTGGSGAGWPGGVGSSSSTEPLLAVIRENVDGMLVIDADGVILLANPAAGRLLGRSSEHLLGTSFGAPLVLDDATEIDVVAAGGSRTAEMRIVTIEWHGRPAFLASLRDVTERKRAEAVLARVGGQHAAIALLGRSAVSGLDPGALMVEAARHVQRVLATDFAAVLALAADDHELRLVAAERSSAALAAFGGLAPPGSQPWFTLGADGPVVMDATAGEERFAPWPPGLASAVTAVVGDREQRFGVVEAAFADPRRLGADELAFLESVADLLAAAIARFDAERHTRYQALHDALTGLPNRVLFLDRLGHALARSGRQGTGLAVLFADLDGFKHVNDTLGHHAGDEVLISLAGRLSDTLRSSDSLARLGGDEFVMLLENVESADELRLAVERVQTAVTGTPFVAGDQPYGLNLTIGVARAEDAHHAPEDLIRDADAAMYRAKAIGRGSYVLFDREMQGHAADRSRLQDELRAALDRDELRLHYQPIVALDSGRIVELEALVRWQHPDRGLLQPADFLDVAIEAGLIVPIGRWVIGEACRRATTWAARGDAGTPTINVNMAPTELAQPELRATIGAAIEHAGAGVRLQLELTEGALIKDPSLPATLRDLSRSIGVRTALDDFGTGYSSLSYLARFKVHELKIDRSFIRTLQAGRDAPIVTAMVSMAHALDILVVAEGIESGEQAAEAHRLGCDRGQGYFYSAALPPDEIPALLALPPWPVASDHGLGGAQPSRAAER